MIDIGHRRILGDGTVICDQKALMEILYSGQDLLGTFCSDPLDQDEWNEAARMCDSGMPGPTHASGEMLGGINWFEHWNTPEPYKSMDMLAWCLERCSNDEEVARVRHEIDLFEKNGMIPVMRHLVYCADVWKKNGVLWGVGRGSSVCSFVLHLIGINRINPFDYVLDIGEWIK